MRSVNCILSKSLFESKDPTFKCFEQLRLEGKFGSVMPTQLFCGTIRFYTPLSLTETLQCQVLVRTSPVQLELLPTQLLLAGEFYPTKRLGVLSLPTPFGTDPQVIRSNSAEPQMLTPGVKL